MQFATSSKSRENDAMELHVWGPAWGLPSIDVESMQAMSYVRFGGAPVKIVECNNPWKSEIGSMPFFKCGDKLLYTVEEILIYLRQKNYSCDYGLTSKQGAEVIAYAQLIDEALHPALQFFSFIHQSNYAETIRPSYGRLLPWFYKLWHTDRRLKRRAHQLIEAIYREAEFEPEQFEAEILVKAERCISILSDKLGTNEYFLHPNSPTKLDAIIFSYLSSFINIPWQHCPIKEYIKATPNLERYISRLSHRYFFPGLTGPAGDTARNTQHSTNATSSSSTSVGSESYPLSHKFLGFFVASAAMLLFAYTNGMFRPRQSLHFPVDDGYWD